MSEPDTPLTIAEIDAAHPPAGESAGEWAELRAENARLTAALAEWWCCLKEQTNLPYDLRDQELHERREARWYKWRDQLLADPTGTEAAARVQALQRTLGHLVVLVLQTSTDADVLEIARVVTIETINGEPYAALARWMGIND